MKTACVFILLVLWSAGCSRTDRNGTSAKHPSGTSGMSKSTKIPEHDFDLWEQKFGRPAEEDVQLDAETRRFRSLQYDAARQHLVEMSQNMSRVYALDKQGAHSFIDSLQTLLSEFSRRQCHNLLQILLPRLGVNSVFAIVDSPDASDESVARAIDNYYYCSCKVADMVWERGGWSWPAAEMDRKIFRGIDKTSPLYSTCQNKGWKMACRTLDACQENWKKERCDSPQSNFAIANAEVEEHFRRYGDRVPEKIKIQYDHVLVEQARRILGRNPIWSPKK